MKDLVRSYLDALAAGDLDRVLKLFACGATVTSPLQGATDAESFYCELLEGTRSSKLTLHHVLHAEDAPVVAAYFRYDWTLDDGTETSFDCVDVFRLDGDGRIEELRILYDPTEARAAYERVRD